MLYRNIKTGVTVEVNSKLGGDWEAVSPKTAEKKRIQKPTEDKAKK